MPTSSVTQAVDCQLDSAPHSSSSLRSSRPTFLVACWLLGLVGFVELITVGAALAVKSPGSRSEEPSSQLLAARVSQVDDSPVTPRTIEQILADSGSSVSGVALQSKGVSKGGDDYGPVRVQPSLEDQPSLSTPPSSLGQPYARPQAVSMIADPRVERLVEDSRKLQLEGDVMRAMLKLDEAERIDPSECAVIYQKGLLFEDMGSYVRAADQYQKIQQMGLMKAGAYFSLAASKLTKGMDTAAARREAIAIGPMKVNRGTGPDAGRHVEVAVTLLARPDQIIDSQDVEVQVFFYDKLNGGEIKKASSNAKISPYWADSKVDWRDAGNEETLRVSYTIPKGNQADEYLLGRREFYGYVVELLYKGEVVDQQAYPRRLNSIHGQSLGPAYSDDLGAPWLPEDNDSLLPDKNAEFGGALPLPAR